MKVFVTGGTGSIGTAVTKALVNSNKKVIALSRSSLSDKHLQAMGAVPLRGDLRRPGEWVHKATACDGIIHIGATFDDDMDVTDRNLVTMLLEAAAVAPNRPRVLYTGGCWLYGATGDQIAPEGPPFSPLPAFSGSVETAKLVLECPDVSAAVLHPAMVYHREGGVFDGFLSAAKTGAPIPVIGNLDTRWPLIHRDDLAAAYLALLDRPDLTGHFNASAETGISVRAIVAAIASRHDHRAGVEVVPVADAVGSLVQWAAGYALDQQMASDRLRGETGWTPLVPDFRASDLFS